MDIMWNCGYRKRGVHLYSGSNKGNRVLVNMAYPSSNPFLSPFPSWCVITTPWRHYTLVCRRPDATVREITTLIQGVLAASRRRNGRLSFALVYPDSQGKHVLRQVNCLLDYTHLLPNACQAFLCHGVNRRGLLWCIRGLYIYMGLSDYDGVY